MRLKRLIALVLMMTVALTNMIPVHAAGTTVVNVTNIDALKIVMDATGIAPKKIANAKDWKECYIQAAHEQKIIDQTAFRKKLAAKITKEGTAELFAKALKVTTDKKVYIADTKNIYVNTLYTLKVIDAIKGKDGKLYFKPISLITKAELTAIAAKANSYYKAKLALAAKPVVNPTPKPIANPSPKPVVNPTPTPVPDINSGSSSQPDESSCH